MQVNKDGADWLLIKNKITERVGELCEDMLRSLPPEEYHRCRGSILFARELIEFVEPTTPPKTEEENYGMSDPGRENY